jgi:hypothetical protein
MNRRDLFTDGTYASIPKALLAVPSKKLSPAAKLVWMTVVERMGEGKDFSWPGAGKIAKATGLSRRKAQQAIEQLERLKLLTVVPPDEQYTSNRYWLTEFASALSALGAQRAGHAQDVEVAHGMRHPSAQSSPPASAQSAPPSAQGSPEVAHGVRPNNPMNNPTSTTQGTTPEAATPPGGFAPSGLAVAGDGDDAHSRSATNQHSNEPRVAGERKQPKPAKQRAKPKAKWQQLPKSDDDKLLACSSPAMMERYLLWGTAGLHQSDDTRLTPAPMNWRAGKPDAMTVEQWAEQWTPAQLAGYYWWNVSNTRHTTRTKYGNGYPITLPDIANLITTVHRGLAKHTAGELLQRIATLTTHWDLIRFELSGANIALDEDALQDPLIGKKIDEIRAAGPFVMRERYAKLHAAMAEQAA